MFFVQYVFLIEEKTVILHMNNKIKDENNHSKSTQRT